MVVAAAEVELAVDARGVSADRVVCVRVSEMVVAAVVRGHELLVVI